MARFLKLNAVLPGISEFPCLYINCDEVVFVNPFDLSGDGSVFGVQIFTTASSSGINPMLSTTYDTFEEACDAAGEFAARVERCRD